MIEVTVFFRHCNGIVSIRATWWLNIRLLFSIFLTIFLLQRYLSVLQLLRYEQHAQSPQLEDLPCFFLAIDTVIVPTTKTAIIVIIRISHQNILPPYALFFFLK